MLEILSQSNLIHLPHGTNNTSTNPVHTTNPNPHTFTPNKNPHPPRRTRQCRDACTVVLCHHTRRNTLHPHAESIQGGHIPQKRFKESHRRRNHDCGYLYAFGVKKKPAKNKTPPTHCANGVFRMQARKALILYPERQDAAKLILRRHKLDHGLARPPCD
jgi:hypothetical protein